MAVTLRVSGKISLWGLLGLYRVKVPGFVQMFRLGYSVTECTFLEQRDNAICFLNFTYSSIHNLYGHTMILKFILD